MKPTDAHIDAIISTALEEDLGKGDITSTLVVDQDDKLAFVIAARQDLVSCGANVAQAVFETFSAMQFSVVAEDGQWLQAGDPLLQGIGNARDVLAAERVALNLLQVMCGVATTVRKFVEAVEGTDVKILDTRKTIPGLRPLQKYACTVGGGYNHRYCLDDGILIKDNHIGLSGSITQAVTKAKASAPHGMKVQVECDTLEQVKDALVAGADMLLLDNMSPKMLKQAVEIVAGSVPLEASGGVTLDTVGAIAHTGVGYISVGSMTSSPMHVDIGLDIYRA